MHAPYPKLGTSARIALLGVGNNVFQRLIPAIEEAKSSLALTGFDIRPPRQQVPFSVEVVSNQHALLQRLAAGHFDTVIIEAPGAKHPELIRLAIEAGIPQVLCEKPLAPTTAEGEKLLNLCREVEPRQRVRLIDHYLCLGVVQHLRDIALAGRLGPLNSLRLGVHLHESKGIATEEVEEHRAGLSAFEHHGVAFMCGLFDPSELYPVKASWDRHHAAPAVADTFRSAEFANRQTGQIVARISVGKYFAVAKRQFVLVGSQGRACLDRESNEIEIKMEDGTVEVIRGSSGDLGYRAIVNALAERRFPESLLTAKAALVVLRLLEEAHAIALRTPIYDMPSVTNLVCDWEILSASRPAYAGGA